MIRKRLWPVLRDGVVVACVAGVVFQALRLGVADRYVVPSGSMEPTLHGDAQCGDVVLVDKLASAAGLRRYDMAVWLSPEDPGRQLVKRVVAFGDDKGRQVVDLRDGDLWLGDTEQQMVRDEKDPLLYRDLRVPWFDWPARGEERLADYLTVPAGALDGGRLRLPACESEEDVRVLGRQGARRVIGEAAPADSGWLRTARAIDVGYLDACGRRKDSSVLLDDIGAEVTMLAAGVDEVFCGLDLRPDAWMFHWDRRQEKVALWRNGETVGQRGLPGDLGAAGPALRLEFGYLDGRFFFAVDGRADALFCVPRRPEWFVPEQAPVPRPGPRTQIHFGARAVGPVEILALQFFHDLFWQRGPVLINEPRPYHVTPGQVFLLGDNSFDSHDSRMFKVGVPLSAFVGRPRVILGPWQRRRWLAR